MGDHDDRLAAGRGRGVRRRLACITFTDRGLELANKTCARLGLELGADWELDVSFGRGEGHEPLAAWAEREFHASDALLFVGACGIAVRAIAPHVRSKASDPAVIVVDEAGTWAISVLSGHIGGANDLARAVARASGAVPVITTATDGRGVWAVDSWAVSQGLEVLNPHAIKRVSSTLLAGGSVRLFSDVTLSGRPPRGVEVVDDACAADVIVSCWRKPQASPEALLLGPRCLSVGVGCRKGIAVEALERGWGEVCERFSILSDRCVASASSIDLKAHEAGLIEFCKRHGWPFVTYGAETLGRVEGSVSSSPFVAGVTGVGNVCERSALARGGRLVVTKQALAGTTFAVAQLDFSVRF